jgi:hypothetical protein
VQPICILHSSIRVQSSTRTWKMSDDECSFNEYAIQVESQSGDIAVVATISFTVMIEVRVIDRIRISRPKLEFRLRLGVWVEQTLIVSSFLSSMLMFLSLVGTYANTPSSAYDNDVVVYICGVLADLTNALYVIFIQGGG